ncbi:LCP family protein [uncultured Ilumatobacter sp.]|jgi:LCP family protein required for cell wall assembly|uniref:LCP family protein n=1 Tax=uncultured Ilumatobacter sp. TaxID=879968 RepID=UPI00374E2E83
MQQHPQGGLLDEPRRRPRRRSSAPLALVLAIIVGVAGAAGVIRAADQRTAKVERIEGLEDILVAVDGPAVNYLLIGSDSRDGSNPAASDFGGIGDTSDVQGRRSDTIMILRQEKDGNGAALMSIPRDLLVTIAGSGKQDRINSAYNQGPEVLAATINQELGIPINHVVDVDFFGFKDLVDTVGGATICFDFVTLDENSGLAQDPGCNLLDGVQALAYARSRHYEEFRDGEWRKDPTADLGRIKRQQAFVATIVNATLTKLQADPFLASELIDSVSAAVRIDNGLDPISAAGTLRKAFSTGLVTYQLDVRGEMFNGKAILRLNDSSKPVIDYFRGLGPLPVAPVAE